MASSVPFVPHSTLTPAPPIVKAGEYYINLSTINVIRWRDSTLQLVFSGGWTMDLNGEAAEGLANVLDDISFDAVNHE